MSGIRHHIAGVPVDPYTMEETVDWVGERVASRVPSTHLCVNAANLVMAADDPSYRDLLERADMVGVDGRPIVWAGQLLDKGAYERVPGIDLMVRLLDESVARGWRIYLLGATAEVVGRLSAQLEERGVQVVGSHHGYLRGDDLNAIVDQAAALGTDILFVGMPSPVKEHVVVREARPAGIPVSVGVGGAFDVIVGDMRRAPAWMQKAGLEWAFRVLQEPRRLFKRYLVGNTRFVLIVGREVLRGGRRRADTAPVPEPQKRGS